MIPKVHNTCNFVLPITLEVKNVGNCVGCCFIESGVSTLQYIVYCTGAQEWHIVSLLGDVTSRTSAVHYVSMTSDLRVLSAEKH